MLLETILLKNDKMYKKNPTAMEYMNKKDKI